MQISYFCMNLTIIFATLLAELISLSKKLQIWIWLCFVILNQVQEKAINHARVLSKLIYICIELLSPFSQKHLQKKLKSYNLISIFTKSWLRPLYPFPSIICILHSMFELWINCPSHTNHEIIQYWYKKMRSSDLINWSYFVMLCIM